MKSFVPISRMIISGRTGLRCSNHTAVLLKPFFLKPFFLKPHLDYASQVWSPHQAYLSDMVEAAQRRATKLMVGNRISYKEHLNKTSLM